MKKHFTFFQKRNIVLIITLFLICCLNDGNQEIITQEQLRPFMFKEEITGDVDRFIPRYVIDKQIPISDFFNLKKPRNDSIFPIDQYTVYMEQITQQILPKVYPKTIIYAYGGQTESGYKVSFPGPSIIARYKIPTKIKWVNKIVNQHILPYDSSYPFQSSQEFLKEVPTVPHVHGMATHAGSDGQPIAYWTASGKKGPRYFTAENCSQNQAVYIYPNQQGAQVLWYHDHTMSMTRLNVYAGLAGLYEIQKPNYLSQNGLSIQETNIIKNYGDNIEKKAIVITDKTFYKNGSLYYPPQTPHPKFKSWLPQFYGNTFVINGKVWPKMILKSQKYRFILLNACQSRFINFFFLNEKTNERISFDLIRQGDYLNNPDSMNQFLFALSSRIQIIIDFSSLSNGDRVLFKNNADAPYPSGDPQNVIDQFTGTMMRFQINNKPPQLTTNYYNSDLFDIKYFDKINYFQTYGIGSSILENHSVNNLQSMLPIHLKPRLPFYPAVEKQIVYQTKTNIQIKTPLAQYPAYPEGIPVYTTLVQQSDADGVVGAQIDGMAFETSFECVSGNTFKIGEVYDFYIINLTPDSHPMHFHLINFQKIKQIPFDPATYQTEWWAVNGGPPPRTGYPKQPKMIDPSPFYTGNQKPLKQFEKSFRDVLNVHPGYVTVIRIKFALNDGNGFSFSTKNASFVYHCHILEHEDNDMMKYYCLEQANQTRNQINETVIEKVNDPLTKTVNETIAQATQPKTKTVIDANKTTQTVIEKANDNIITGEKITDPKKDVTKINEKTEQTANDTIKINQAVTKVLADTIETLNLVNTANKVIN